MVNGDRGCKPWPALPCDPILESTLLLLLMLLLQDVDIAVAVVTASTSCISASLLPTPPRTDPAGKCGVGSNAGPAPPVSVSGSECKLRAWTTAAAGGEGGGGGANCFS